MAASDNVSGAQFQKPEVLHADTGAPMSYNVTSDQLTDMGFPVEKYEKVVGSKHIMQAGKEHHEARYDAEQAGKVKVGVRPRAEWEGSLAKREAKQGKGPAKVDPEMAAYYKKIKQ